MSTEENLKKLNISLPKAPDPVGAYVASKIVGNLVFISGQVPFINGKIRDDDTGKVGENIDIAKAQTIARRCGINVVSVLKDALDGDLSRVIKCVKLGIFVSCTNDFHDQPEVANGASDLMVEIFGEAGRHARFAVGTNSLPRNIPVEVDAIFEFK